MWRKVDYAMDMVLPCKRTGHTATVIGNKMFVFGYESCNIMIFDSPPPKVRCAVVAHRQRHLPSIEVTLCKPA